MFTFKTERATGRYASFYPDHHYIKIKRQQMGMIGDSFPHKIMLAVKKEPTKEEPADFKWITLKKESESVKAAKVWLNENYEAITKKYNLHLFEK